VSDSDALLRPLEQFLATVVPALTGLGSARDADALAGDVVAEAAELLGAFIDADGIHTHAEARAYVHAIGGHDRSVAASDPEDLRRSGLFTGRRAWLERPSPMFRLLVDADRTDDGTRAWSYFRVALDLAHAVASLDVHTSQAELDAISRYRRTLVETLEAAGVQRPGPGFFGLDPAALAEAQRRVHGRAPETPSTPTTEAAPPTESTESTEPTPAPVGELPPPRPVEELLAELDELVGMEPVKAEVRLLTNLLVIQRLREERGLPVMTGSRHLVFTGNPGTGKTTVARLLAEIYRSLGVVVRGHLVETDRSALVAGYVGQTATRTRDVIESALDGVLLIDEAYALARGNENDFGREAIDTLVKLMEDHRKRLIVIAAGYPDEMAMLIAANPGLESRFPKTLHFPDYSADELVAIFEIIARKHHYDVVDDTREALRKRFTDEPRGRGFGNGRLARNLFEAAVAHQASRLVEVDDPSDRDLVVLLADDIPAREPA
jgi:Holliday junction resolvasome RuvABC ATP-dependent DNA helicase subunit